MDVGFVGLGNMGSRMARNIVANETPVIGFDPVRENVERTGAIAVSGVAEVAQRCDVILMSLPSSEVVEEVVLGRDGLVHALRPGSVVADLSTAAPESTRHIHTSLAAHGVSYVDAGVSGGAAAAEKGTVTLMVGGDEPAVDVLQPVFEQIAAKVFVMGGPGAGHTAKLLNNFLNGINLSAGAEVLIAGAKAGLDVSGLLEVINASSGANWATENRFPSIVRGDYLEGGLTSNLMMKDLLLYVEHLRELGVPSFHASGPVAAFGVALQTDRGEEISNRVVDALGDLAGGVRLHAETDERKSES